MGPGARHGGPAVLMPPPPTPACAVDTFCCACSAHLLSLYCCPAYAAPGVPCEGVWRRRQHHHRWCVPLPCTLPGSSACRAPGFHGRPVRCSFVVFCYWSCNSQPVCLPCLVPRQVLHPPRSPPPCPFLVAPLSADAAAFTADVKQALHKGCTHQVCVDAPAQIRELARTGHRAGSLLIDAALSKPSLPPALTASLPPCKPRHPATALGFASPQLKSHPPAHPHLSPALTASPTLTAGRGLRRLPGLCRSRRLGRADPLPL